MVVVLPTERGREREREGGRGREGTEREGDQGIREQEGGRGGERLGGGGEGGKEGEGKESDTSLIRDTLSGAWIREVPLLLLD